MSIGERRISLLGQATFMVGAGIVALILGLAAAILPPFIIAALLFFPVFIVVTWAYPVVSLLLVLALAYGLVHPAFVPSIPFAGGRFQAADLALLGMSVVLAVKTLGRWGAVWRTVSPVVVPLGLLAFLVAISFAAALVFFHTPLKHVLADGRNFVYWLLVPLVVAISLSGVPLRRFLMGLVILGYGIAFVLVAQHVTGVDLLSAGRTEELVTLDRTTDVIRTTSPGIYVVALALMLVVARVLAGRLSAFFGVLAALPLVLGLLVTFGRGVWVATALGVLFLAYTIDKRQVWKLVLLGAIGGGILAAGLWFAKPETLDAAVARVSSVGAELERGSSAEWRYLENEYAVEHLMRSPLVGVGLGGFAHPKLHPRMDEDLLRYVHNGYLYLAVKLGVFGLLVPLLIAVVVFRGTPFFRPRPFRAVPLEERALMAAFLVPCLTSATQPEWMVHTGVAFIATIVGLLLVSRRDAESLPKSGMKA